MERQRSGSHWRTRPLLPAWARAFPREVIEAARMDGAGSFRILWQVAVPGRMLRACAMRGLAPEGVAALPALGVTTEIDLRGPAEAAEASLPL